MILEEQIYVF